MIVMPHSPTARLIADALDASGKTQREVAEEVGFPRGNVISMLRSGEMRLPIERAPALARALGINEKLLEEPYIENFCLRASCDGERTVGDYLIGTSARTVSTT